MSIDANNRFRDGVLAAKAFQTEGNKMEDGRIAKRIRTLGLLDFQITEQADRSFFASANCQNCREILFTVSSKAGANFQTVVALLWNSIYNHKCFAENR